MKRKVVKHGPSTLIISIPSAWARKYGIKQGDELDVDEQESRLIIDTKGERKLPEITIDISDLPNKIVSRFLVNSYQIGYDKINITHESPKQQIIIQNKIPEFLGYEIIERTNEGCVIKNIATKIDIDFQPAVRKIFLLTKSMINDLYEAYNENDKKRLANIPFKDLDINKYAHFCLRTINKGLFTGYPPEDTHMLYHFIITLEILADNYKKLAKLLVNFEKDKKIYNIILKIKNYFEFAYDFFYKPDKKKLLEAMHIDQEIFRKIKESFRITKDSKKLLILTLLNNIAQTNYHLTSRIQTFKR